MSMLRWARGKTRLDHIRNEDLRKEAHVKTVETFLENKRLKWFVRMYKSGKCYFAKQPGHKYSCGRLQTFCRDEDVSFTAFLVV